MNEAEKEDAAKFNIELCAGTDLVRHLFEYDLNNILSRLIYTRILFPSSKKSSFEESKKFIEQPSFGLHDIYRALSVMAEETDYIQSRLFKNSSNIQKRNTQVIYYDCRITDKY